MIAVIVTLLSAAPAMAGNGQGGNRGQGIGNQDGTGRWKKGPGRRGFKGDFVERMVKHLNLTADQETKVRALHEEHKNLAEPLREKLKVLHEEMRAAWQVPEPSEVEIIELQRQIHALKGELAELRVQLRIDVMTILTPEQREQMAQFHKMGRGKGMGRGMGRRGGGRGHGPGFGAGSGQGPMADDQTQF